MNLKKSRQNTISNVDRGQKKAQALSGRRDVDLLTANNNTFLPILPKLSPSEYQDIQREGTGNSITFLPKIYVLLTLYLYVTYTLSSSMNLINEFKTELL